MARREPQRAAVANSESPRPPPFSKFAEMTSGGRRSTKDEGTKRPLAPAFALSPVVRLTTFHWKSSPASAASAMIQRRFACRTTSVVDDDGGTRRDTKKEKSNFDLFRGLSRAATTRATAKWKTTERRAAAEHRQQRRRGVLKVVGGSKCAGGKVAFVLEETESRRNS